jgi:hypothetical protein
MSTTLARLLIGGFLVAHGLVHGLFLSPIPSDAEEAKKWAFHLDRSWLLGRLGFGPSALRRICMFLCAVTIAAFVLAGLGVFFGADWWRLFAAVGAASGLVLLVLYWHVWLWIGISMNAAILVLLLWANWPPASAIGE